MSRTYKPSADLQNSLPRKLRPSLFPAWSNVPNLQDECRPSEFPIEEAPTLSPAWNNVPNHKSSVNFRNFLPRELLLSLSSLEQCSEPTSRVSATRISYLGNLGPLFPTWNNLPNHKSSASFQKSLSRKVRPELSLKRIIIIVPNTSATTVPRINPYELLGTGNEHQLLQTAFFAIKNSISNVERVESMVFCILQSCLVLNFRNPNVRNSESCNLNVFN